MRIATLCWLATVAWTLPSSGVLADPPLEEQGAVLPSTGSAVSDSALEAQVKAIASTLRCPVCQNLSLEDSPSELARAMRDLVRERLLAGDSPDEVRAYFVSRYGEWVLLKPTTRGFNLTVWIVPVAALLAGIVIVFSVVRRWTTRRTGPPVSTVDKEMLARVRRELEEFEARRG